MNVPRVNSPGRATTSKSNGILTNNAILLKTEVVHGFINSFLDLLPVRSSLNEFIHILPDGVSVGIPQYCCVNYLGSVRSTITRSISYDLCKILGVVHNKYMTKHLQMRKIRGNVLGLIIETSFEHRRAGDYPADTFNPDINEW